MTTPEQYDKRVRQILEDLAGDFQYAAAMESVTESDDKDLKGLIAHWADRLREGFDAFYEMGFDDGYNDGRCSTTS